MLGSAARTSPRGARKQTRPRARPFAFIRAWQAPHPRFARCELSKGGSAASHLACEQAEGGDAALAKLVGPRAEGEAEGEQRRPGEGVSERLQRIVHQLR